MKKNKIIKKLLKLPVLTILLFLLLPGFISAQGLVPCGGTDRPPCELCHFFVLFDKIINFVWFTIVPPVAILMLAIAGVMFFVAAGDPTKLNQAKSIFTSVIMGLIIVYGAWFMINLFFLIIGVADWTGLREGWFKIPFIEACP